MKRNPPVTVPSATYIDLFHLPFPAVEAYLDAHPHQSCVRSSTKQATHDLLLRLPAELSALVFSLLSPAALDAARCVCRAWRSKILRDTWVLSSVLEPKKAVAATASSGRETGRALHRSLLKKLDAESVLVETFEHPDSWRTRFRERKIEFCLPHQQYIDKSFMYNSAFTSIKLCDTADFVAFMINERPSPDYVCTLIVYRLGLAGRPIYVGSTQYSKSRTQSLVPRVQDMVANRLSRAWVIKLKIGPDVASYLVTSSEAFANDDDEFKLLPLGCSFPEDSVRDQSALTKGDEKQMIDAIIESLNTVGKTWLFLACLPKSIVHDGWIEKDTRRTRKLVIAKHIETGNIFMLDVKYLMHMYDDDLVSGTQISGNLVKVVALLCPPRQDLCFRNLTVAPFLGAKGHALIGIIWQETETEDSRLELYYYNAPCNSFRDILRAESFVGPNRVTGLYDVAPASGIPSRDRNSQSYISIHGKRIASVAPYMGGIHPSSPLRDLDNTRTSICEDEEALGGLQLFCDPGHSGEHLDQRREDCLVQKMMVWGRSEKGSSHITLRIFYLNFADPSQLQLYQRSRRWTGADTSPSQHNFCACPLHDDCFRVTLPDTSCQTLSHHPLHSSSSGRKSILSSLLKSSWKSNVSPVVSASKGSVEQCDPPARLEALRREKDFYRGAIISMKRSGMSNESIETEWSGARVTCRGKIPKPIGWREF